MNMLNVRKVYDKYWLESVIDEEWQHMGTNKIMILFYEPKQPEPVDYTVVDSLEGNVLDFAWNVAVDKDYYAFKCFSPYVSKDIDEALFTECYLNGGLEG